MEKRWLCPKDLLVRWQAKPFEVVDAIKKGLPLYDVMTGECYNDAETPGKICLKLQQILPQQNSAWEHDLFNSDPWETVEVGFKLSEVEVYEKKHGVSLTTENYAITEELSDLDQNIQAWANKARHNGHIDILKLCHILAFDQKSSAALPALWQAYEIEKGLYPLKTDSFNERVGAWFKLMSLWTTGYNGIRYDDDITCIKTGCCEGGSYVDDPTNKGNRVNLQTLKDYFTDTLLVQTPLPQILFPDLLEPLKPLEPCGVEGNNDKKGSSIKTPPGTKWRDIRIYLVHEGLIKITYPKGETTTTRDGLGLGGNKKKAWKEFEEFAASKGYYGFGPGVIRRNLKDKKYRVNKILKELFPNVEGDPIVFHKRKYDEDRKMWFEEKYESELIIKKIDTEFVETHSNEDAIAQEFRDYENSESMW